MKYYTIKELTVMLKVDRQFIRRKIINGELKANNISKTGVKPYWRISEEALQEFLKTK